MSMFHNCFKKINASLIFTTFIFSFLIFFTLFLNANAQVISSLATQNPAPNWSISFSFDGQNITEGGVYEFSLNEQKQTTYTYPKNISGSTYIEIYKGVIQNSQLVSSILANNTGTLNTQSSFSQTGEYFAIIYEVPKKCTIGDFCLLPNHQDIQNWLQFGYLKSLFPPTNYGLINFKITKPTQTLSALTYSEEVGYQEDAISQGIKPNKGTASSTKFTFKVLYQNKANKAPTYINLVVSDGTNTQTFPMIQDTTTTSTPQLYDNDFTNKEQYIYQDIAQKGKYQYHFEASDGITTVRLPETGELGFEAGYSNVMFLPGIQASRLYSSDGTMIWEPNSNSEALKIELNPDGTSKDLNIYVKENEIIDEITSAPIPQPNIYKSFIKKMNTFTNEDKIIKEWKPIAYDWRLSFDDILSNGHKQGDKIYYSYAISTPYIIEELKRLQETSANGKVSIVTHSMGGLIAKALIRKLEDENNPAIQNIDKLIMVAVPQLGTPKAVVSLLHGEETNLFKRPVINQQTKRYLAQNMQSAYNLLPSEKYFQVVDTISQPIIEFDPTSTLSQIFRNTYGNVIGDNFIEFNNFLLGKEGRVKPLFEDVYNPEKLNEILLNNAISIHNNTLDNWLPPKNIKLTQIAGWGDQKTIRGIYYSQAQSTECSIFTLPICQTKTVLDPQPRFTQDGDGTVVIPSALALETESYYLNLEDYNSKEINRDHGNIFEVDSIFDIIKQKVTNTFNDLSLPKYFSTTKPPTKNPYYRLAIYSPVSINIYDAKGRHTGLVYNSNTSLYYPEEQIPNSYYLELGEGKYIGFDANNTYQVELKGEDYGTFTLEVKKVLGDEVLQKTLFLNIPVSPKTKAQLNTKDQATPTLNIDTNGDGQTDTVLTGNEQQDTKASFEILKNITDQMTIKKSFKKKLTKRIKKAEKAYKKGKTDKSIKKLDKIIKKLEKEIKRNISSNEDKDEGEGDDKEENKHKRYKERHHKEKDKHHYKREYKQKISTEDSQRLIVIIEQVKNGMLK